MAGFEYKFIFIIYSHLYLIVGNVFENQLFTLFIIVYLSYIKKLQVNFKALLYNSQVLNLYSKLLKIPSL